MILKSPLLAPGAPSMCTFRSVMVNCSQSPAPVALSPLPTTARLSVTMSLFVLVRLSLYDGGGNCNRSSAGRLNSPSRPPPWRIARR